MSTNSAVAQTGTQADMTDVIGYFNPNPYRVCVEISDLGLKVELEPNQYIRDRSGSYINDPVFDSYVQPKGLSKSLSQVRVPVNWVPRPVKSARPVHAVTQASGFVRQQDGQTVPAYPTAPMTQATNAPMNKTPHFGMSIEQARKLGFIGRPHVVPEDYGVTDTSGAPPHGRDVPPMKYSLESTPKVQTAAPIRPELMQMDEALTPEEVSRRLQMRQTLNRAAQDAAPETFNPAAARSAASPVKLVAPDAPTSFSDLVPASAPIQSRPPAPPLGAHAPAGVPTSSPAIPQRVLPRKIASVVLESSPEAPPRQLEATAAPSGVPEPIGSGMPDPVLDSPAAPLSAGQQQADTKRFVCAADGKTFKYRSELERYARRKYPDLVAELMQPYPAEG